MDDEKYRGLAPDEQAWTGTSREFQPTQRIAPTPRLTHVNYFTALIEGRKKMLDRDSCRLELYRLKDGTEITIVKQVALSSCSLIRAKSCTLWPLQTKHAPDTVMHDIHGTVSISCPSSDL